MPEQFLNLAIQAPIFGIFVWYAYTNNKEWRKYLSERNGKLEKSLDKIDATMSKIHEEIIKK